MENQTPQSPEFQPPRPKKIVSAGFLGAERVEVDTSDLEYIIINLKIKGQPVLAIELLDEDLEIDDIPSLVYSALQINNGLKAPNANS